ncbi:SdpI family protein [Lysobacter solisilvae (ex Woo and Kim 2020)]|uniref:SdpI family protein n=1 Tax=Agrilutibacter terrestris TaxID=2865112 RepID=A0A7H0FVX8_9GAMM|nr:SdpI family protein [Lysobacter terrestris]
MKAQLTAALFFCALGVLLILKAIPPNRWFGLRTTRTLADPAVWYRAHRAYGWLFLAIGLVAATLGLWPTTPVHPAWGLVGVLVLASATILVYRRYAA